MCHTRWIRFVATALTVCIIAAHAPVRADGIAISDEIPDGTAVVDPGADLESKAGVFGSVVCGAGSWLIRTNPAIGMNPYVLSATIGGCLLMVLDCWAESRT